MAIDPLKHLPILPRPVYGSAQALPNQALSYRHQHDWAQLSYAPHGFLHIDTDRARFVALPQRAIWIPPGLSHSVKSTTDTVIRSLYLDTRAIALNWTECRVLVIQPLLHELILTFSTLPIEYDESGPQGRLVQVLIDQLADAPDVDTVLPWPTDKRLLRVCQDQQQYPDTNKTLLKYSQELGISDKTLSRLFLQQTGLSFRQWRQRSRLLAALPMLERGERITDVAIACGYESLSSFIATFREAMGITPRAFALASVR
ncbi:helix-turn-helix transcriptional regulator [Alcaligenaceae bacterium CGII-47]|nr:helix-turn-helix transcriptional regulator [Alcaligenaceae bacterium CGII-47]